MLSEYNEAKENKVLLVGGVEYDLQIDKSRNEDQLLAKELNNTSSDSNGSFTGFSIA